MHSWHLTVQHQWKTHRHFSMRVLCLVTWPLPQHRRSQLSTPLDVALHTRPLVPSMPSDSFLSQKFGDASKKTRSSAEGCPKTSYLVKKIQQKQVWSATSFVHCSKLDIKILANVTYRFRWKQRKGKVIDKHNIMNVIFHSCAVTFFIKSLNIQVSILAALTTPVVLILYSASTRPRTIQRLLTDLQ